MSTADCKHARLAIGGEPGHLPPEVAQHVSGCADCRRFHDETLAMEVGLKAALELPLHRFRAAAPTISSPRRLALAASVLLALLVGAGAFLFRPQAALANEVIEHVRHEPGSWQPQSPLSAEQIAAVLDRAGVRYDARMPVTYASPCPFRGRIVPHLVVRTESGLMTVMVLAHERTASRRRFSEGGYQGVLLPAGAGSIAVVTRQGQEFDRYLEQVLAGVN
jgi:hypothetical protein